MSEIIHVDLDGFFVAVERQLDPRLASRPVVIGGQPSTHGVVVAACAEAARRGVRPGLSLAIAAARCPDAAFLDGAVERYLEASAAVDEILRDPHLTGNGAAVEWTAIDSVFIAVGTAAASGGASSGAGTSGDGLRVAERLRERLARELGFEVSCGIAKTRAAAQNRLAHLAPAGRAVCPARLRSALARAARHRPAARPAGRGAPAADDGARHDARRSGRAV